MVFCVASGTRSRVRSRLRSVRRLRSATSVAVSSGLPVLGLGDGDAHAVGVVLDAHGVVRIHVDERRDVEVLVEDLDPALALALRPQRVEAPLVVRVVDLDDDDLHAPVCVAAEVEAGRVELVAQHARRGDEGDAPALGIEAFLAQVASAPTRAGRWLRGRQWSRSCSASALRPVAAEEPQAARATSSISVEVEREVEDVVLELVDLRLRAPMADLAREQVRPQCGHAATGDRRLSLWRPSRRPRSRIGSRPRGSRSRGGRRRRTCAGGPAARPGPPGRRACRRCTWGATWAARR